MRKNTDRPTIKLGKKEYVEKAVDMDAVNDGGTILELGFEKPPVRGYFSGIGKGMKRVRDQKWLRKIWAEQKKQSRG
jgi:hypothetical protein